MPFPTLMIDVFEICGLVARFVENGVSRSRVIARDPNLYGIGRPAGRNVTKGEGARTITKTNNNQPVGAEKKQQ